MIQNGLLVGKPCFELNCRSLKCNHCINENSSWMRQEF